MTDPLLNYSCCLHHGWLDSKCSYKYNYTPPKCVILVNFIDTNQSPFNVFNFGTLGVSVDPIICFHHRAIAIDINLNIKYLDLESMLFLKDNGLN